MVAALKKELIDRSAELTSDEIQTIYLGGGTPSVLQVDELGELLETIRRNYRVSQEAEITMEANPDDLSLSKIQSIRQLGYNRLSMGIQSFSEPDLRLMNRRHSVDQAIRSVEWAKSAGFDNISIDLIYGLPNQTPEEWERGVRQAVGLGVQHISAYHLTYHEGTVFYEQLKKGLLKELPDDTSLRQFDILRATLKEAGFEHYEISNFCQPGFYSKHNSSYWKNEKYLGIGPSAHSFDLKTRRWNVSSVSGYLKGIESGEPYFESEILTEQDRYNDYIITGLRTVWGISETAIQTGFSVSYNLHFQKILQKYLASGQVKKSSGMISLNAEGMFVSDQIMADFMVVESC